MYKLLIDGDCSFSIRDLLTGVKPPSCMADEYRAIILPFIPCFLSVVTYLGLFPVLLQQLFLITVSLLFAGKIIIYHPFFSG